MFEAWCTVVRVQCGFVFVVWQEETLQSNASSVPSPNVSVARYSLIRPHPGIMSVVCSLRGFSQISLIFGRRKNLRRGIQSSASILVSSLLSEAGGSDILLLDVSLRSRNPKTPQNIPKASESRHVEYDIDYVYMVRREIWEWASIFLLLY